MIRAIVLALPLVLLTVQPLLAGGEGSVVADSWLQKGHKALKMGNAAEAEKCYKKALEIEPKNKFAHGNLVLLYVRAKRYADAIPEADAAIAGGWNITGLFWNRAESRRQLALKENDPQKKKDLYDKAIVDCDKVINYQANKLELSDKQDLSYAHATISMCYQALGQQDLAQKHRNKALELNPKLKDQ
jgi:tetratricopeptide (TPR) repeat protein